MLWSPSSSKLIESHKFIGPEWCHHHHHLLLLLYRHCCYCCRLVSWAKTKIFLHNFLPWSKWIGKARRSEGRHAASKLNVINWLFCHSVCIVWWRRRVVLAVLVRLQTLANPTRIIKREIIKLVKTFPKQQKTFIISVCRRNFVWKSRPFARQTNQLTHSPGI